MSIRILHIFFVTGSNAIADYLTWQQQQEAKKNKNITLKIILNFVLE